MAAAGGTLGAKLAGRRLSLGEGILDFSHGMGGLERSHAHSARPPVAPHGQRDENELTNKFKDQFDQSYS